MSKDAKPLTIEWPLAYNAKQAADLLGWPEAFVKQCRKAGCPAFKHSRVYIGELVKWVGTKGEESDIDWSRHLKKFQALNEEEDHKKKKNQVVEIDTVRAKAAAIGGFYFSEMERVFLNEQPAICKGMDEYGIRAKNKAYIEGIRTGIQAKIKDMSGDK